MLICSCAYIACLHESGVKMHLVEWNETERELLYTQEHLDCVRTAVQ